MGGSVIGDYNWNCNQIALQTARPNGGPHTRPRSSRVACTTGRTGAAWTATETAQVATPRIRPRSAESPARATSALFLSLPLHFSLTRTDSSLRARNSCRKRRIKCQAYPNPASIDAPCVICTDAGAPHLCTYSKPPRKRGPQAGKARSLAEKCATLQRLLGYLATTIPNLETYVQDFAAAAPPSPPPPPPAPPPPRPPPRHDRRRLSASVREYENSRDPRRHLAATRIRSRRRQTQTRPAAALAPEPAATTTAGRRSLAHFDISHVSR